MFADCGVAAAHANDVDMAREMLDGALDIMSSITVGGLRENRAASLEGAESEKLFKGEPHERVLAYIYRGLLYMAAGEYDNAQACFKSASLQDAFAEGKEYRSNWLSADLLQLVCMKLRDDVNVPEFIRDMKSRYGVELEGQRWVTAEEPPRFVILVAAGYPPEKLAGKEYGKELAYACRPSRVNAVSASTDHGTVHLPRTDDVYNQAITRGHRQMDDILARKAEERKKVEGLGSVAAGLAPLAGGGAGIALALLKELSWSSSDKIRSDADCRQMRAAPGAVYMYVETEETPLSRVSIQAFDEGGRVLARGGVAAEGAPWPNGRLAVVIGRIPY